jgi:hypothetical protein
MSSRKWNPEVFVNGRTLPRADIPYLFVYECVGKLRALRGLPINGSDFALLTCYGRAMIAKAAAGREEKLCYHI